MTTKATRHPDGSVLIEDDSPGPVSLVISREAAEAVRNLPSALKQRTGWWMCSAYVNAHNGISYATLAFLGDAPTLAGRNPVINGRSVSATGHNNVIIWGTY